MVGFAIDMKYKLRSRTVTAVQWKGWPHKIKHIKEHAVYPQLAMGPFGQEVYEGDWIVNDHGEIVVMNDGEFNDLYEKIK